MLQKCEKVFLHFFQADSLTVSRHTLKSDEQLKTREACRELHLYIYIIIYIYICLYVYVNLFEYNIYFPRKNMDTF